VATLTGLSRGREPHPEDGRVAEKKILKVPASLLKADPRNARTIEAPGLRGLGVSMETFGDLSGIVWNERSGHLVAGHQRMNRLRAAGAEDWVREGASGVIVHPKTGERFGIRIVDWDDTTERMANLTANNPAIQGEFTEEAAEQLRALEDEVAFEALRLDDLRDDLDREVKKAEEERAEGNTDPDDVCAVVDGVSQLGDLWILGGHRLLCGDSTNREHVARLMNGEKAVLMATDPPYGVDFSGAKFNPRAKEWDGIANDKLQGADLEGFVAAVLKAWIGFMDKTAAFYFWTAPMAEGAAAAAAAIRGAGIHVQSQIIWVKNSLVLGQADYQWKHETAWYGFWKGENHRWFGGRAKTSVWEVSRVAQSEYVHPMQKPVELYEIPQQHHTHKGEVVAEPFSGSGSQIIAGERLGRRVYAMELEPKYVDVAVTRWEAYTGKKAVRQPASSKAA
jgi:DNA modification methylase